MKKSNQLLLGLSVALFLGSCVKNYRCQCDGNGQVTTIETSDMEEAEAACDAMEYSLGEAQMSGDCHLQ